MKKEANPRKRRTVIDITNSVSVLLVKVQPRPRKLSTILKAWSLQITQAQCISTKFGSKSINPIKKDLHIASDVMPDVVYNV